MNTLKSILKVTWVAISILALTKNSSGVGETSALFLTLSPCTRANGMGESLVAVADPAATYFNPAALGLFSLKQIGAMGWGKTDWFPDWQTDMEPVGFYANLGFNSRQVDPDSPFDAAIACQYRSQLFDYGQTEGRDENNIPTGTYSAYDINRSLVAAVGVEYGFEIGLGVAIGNIRSRQGPSSQAKTGQSYDLGVQLRLPIRQMIKKYSCLDICSNTEPWSFELAPSFGFAHLNSGDGLYSDYTGRTPFPEMNRYGWAVEYQLDYSTYPLLTVLWTQSWSHHLVLKDHNGNPFEEAGWGYEITVFETYSFRQGRYSSNLPEINRDTSGWGLQSRGLTRFIHQTFTKDSLPETSLLNYLLNHVSFDLNFSNWEAEYPTSPLDNTAWYEIRLVF